MSNLKLAIIATLFVSASFGSFAQCQFAAPTCFDSSLAPNTDCYMYYTGGMSLFNACTTTAMNNASCNKQTVVRRAIEGVNTVGLEAHALSTATAPYCQWQCDCGFGSETLRIDGGDGLPVELMNFSVSPHEEGGPQ